MSVVHELGLLVAPLADFEESILEVGRLVVMRLVVMRLAAMRPAAMRPLATGLLLAAAPRGVVLAELQELKWHFCSIHVEAGLWTIAWEVEGLGLWAAAAVPCLVEGLVAAEGQARPQGEASSQYRSRCSLFLPWDQTWSDARKTATWRLQRHFSLP